MFGLNSTVGEMWHFSLLNLEYETQTMSVRGSGSWGLTRSQMWLCASPAQFTGLPWRWPVNSLASLLTTVMQFFHKARVERNVNSSTWNVISFAEIWTKIKEQIKWLSWWWSLMKSQGINNNWVCCGDHECLHQISWLSIQNMLRYITKKWTKMSA